MTQSAHDDPTLGHPEPGDPARSDARVQLHLGGISKTFEGESGSVIALDGVDLSIQKGEIVTLIGPSGCGKSTLLKIIAGLIPQSTGDVELDGVPMRGPGPDRAVVFQEHRLFPWLNVERNIAANLSLRDPDVRERVERLLEITGLQQFRKAFPKELSGGMAQRVSIARALLRNPAVLLLDEPFGALDAFTRARMQEVLIDVWERNRTTMLFVTHDIDEAVTLGHRVVLMRARPGRIDSVVEVPLDYPRDRTSSEFDELRLRVVTRFGQIGRDE